MLNYVHMIPNTAEKLETLAEKMQFYRVVPLSCRWKITKSRANQRKWSCFFVIRTKNLPQNSIYLAEPKICVDQWHTFLAIILMYFFLKEDQKNYLQVFFQNRKYMEIKKRGLYILLMAQTLLLIIIIP